ncbi:hypothetical protein A2U01_0000452 [Trifolium medium]|uniref:Uncharacterized protein n=1 Tax=Trifolium medium TaxID=97028 RepID=A0A392LXP6_9FABA|nr:hypothetical protein [Trifolium medium]
MFQNKLTLSGIYRFRLFCSRKIAPDQVGRCYCSRYSTDSFTACAQCSARDELEATDMVVQNVEFNPKVDNTTLKPVESKQKNATDASSCLKNRTWWWCDVRRLLSAPPPSRSAPELLALGGGLILGYFRFGVSHFRSACMGLALVAVWFNQHRLPHGGGY